MQMLISYCQSYIVLQVTQNNLKSDGKKKRLDSLKMCNRENKKMTQSR